MSNDAALLGALVASLDTLVALRKSVEQLEVEIERLARTCRSIRGSIVTEH